MQFRSVNTSKPLYRAVLAYRGQKYKLLNFMIGKDNSFYVHLYRQAGEPWRTSDNPVTKGTVLDLAQFEANSFDMHKVSYHPSGFHHVTDPNGKRLNDKQSTPPFDQLPMPYNFLAVSPALPSILVPYSANRKSWDLTISLTDDAKPFLVQFSIWKTDTPFASDPQPDTDIAYCFSQPGLQFGLLIFLRSILPPPEGVAPNWPPFTFWLRRVSVQ